MVKFYPWDAIADEEITFAVIVARYQNQYVMVQHKKRDTWEIPGGHREPGETVNKCASRELVEETGAISFDLYQHCIYSVVHSYGTADENESFGGLYYAQITELGELPDLEIGTVRFFDALPENLTYPHIQSYIFEEINKQFIAGKVF
ncbi:NUDIX hydrolase [Culicoidibacter larvae]|uniref:NUDIX domain-containing protein n=1 Tax=Culicoidibacter larvae TaxID=2579976 RepID=A0A5R8Q9L3_9FIRM|nr:NUDIX domain-containing protein [Culicoidibacter larvae]TLG72127.1 NUDIX domain-containing protein [Culicoidibacter larvae]